MGSGWDSVGRGWLRSKLWEISQQGGVDALRTDPARSLRSTDARLVYSAAAIPSMRVTTQWGSRREICRCW